VGGRFAGTNGTPHRTVSEASTQPRFDCSFCPNRGHQRLQRRLIGSLPRQQAERERQHQCRRCRQGSRCWPHDDWTFPPARTRDNLCCRSRLRRLHKEEVARLAGSEMSGHRVSLALAQPAIEVGRDRLEIEAAVRAVGHRLRHEELFSSTRGSAAALSTSRPWLKLWSPSANRETTSALEMPSAAMLAPIVDNRCSIVRYSRR